MKRLIDRDRSLIPACDVTKADFEHLLRETASLSEVGAYKIGAQLALMHGLPAVVKFARRCTAKPLIYDHQKAGTDIPDTGESFLTIIKNAGIDAVILFPLSGPETQTQWIRVAQKIHLPVIIGFHMTHPKFVSSEGGYIDDSAADRIVEIAVAEQVTDFVVPGNKPRVIEHVRAICQAAKIVPTFYAPGFVAQGGSISDAASVAGPTWHAIVGRQLYNAKDIRRAAEELAASLQ